MSILRIEHIANEDEARFQVVRVKDNKRAPGVVVKPPVGYPVEGRPNSDLVQELRWYLEKFLDYPFSPETEHADRVQGALAAVGRND